MKYLPFAVTLSSLFLLSGCPDDDAVACNKAVFNLGGSEDTEGSAGRLAAVVSGDTVSFQISYTCDFPSQYSDEEVVEELGGPAELTITNNTTGVTVSLASAIEPSLDETPNAPGEWSIGLDSDEKTVTLTLFNELETGQTLKLGGDYTAVFSLGPNDAAEEILATSADLEIVEE